MKNYTKAVCNTAVKKFYIFYPLEAQLRVLGQKPGAYLIGIFDCCRANFIEPSRGGG